MVNGIPVETVSIGKEGSKSSACRPVARATDSRSCWAPNTGSTCVISPNVGCPEASSKRTGTFPTFSSSVTSLVLFLFCKANAVPSVGCPANGNSSCTVKILTGITRENECGLGKVHLSRDRLHFLVAQAARVRQHRQRVSFQRFGREHVPL